MGLAVQELKRLYADALTQGLEPFEAAMAVVTNEDAEAIGTNRFRIAEEWPKDAEVMAFQEVAAPLPSRDQFLRTVFRDYQACRDPNAKAKLAMVFAQANGWIEKPGSRRKDENTPHNVLKVPMAKSDAEWEEIAIAQQRDLTGQTSH